MYIFFLSETQNFLGVAKCRGGPAMSRGGPAMSRGGPAKFKGGPAKFKGGPAKFGGGPASQKARKDRKVVGGWPSRLYGGGLQDFSVSPSPLVPDWAF